MYVSFQRHSHPHISSFVFMCPLLWSLQPKPRDQDVRLSIPSWEMQREPGSEVQEDSPLYREEMKVIPASHAKPFL
jgi:hypothetical protein